ncbi:unnamed protein product [Protopolystoma xenopodis]|uniref:Uncharacterized protein n=1 Tax=Protopolystoma xenopodis TaxID=117903 RepID=A0A448WW61_9PLAT|nr:unnamed protein product [Protopolystoma xenopodis]
MPTSGVPSSQPHTPLLSGETVGIAEGDKEAPDHHHNIDDGDDEDNAPDELPFMLQPETPYLPPPSILSEAPHSIMHTLITHTQPRIFNDNLY